jgi:hypothetical protein
MLWIFENELRQKLSTKFVDQNFAERVQFYLYLPKKMMLQV